LIQRTTPDTAWDEWLERAGREADFLQTTSWATIDGAANDAHSVVLRAESVGGLVSVSRETGGELRCFRGPVVREPLEAEELHDFVSAAEALAKERGCTSMQFVGRPVLSAVDPEWLATRLRRQGFSSTLWLTSVVDLDRSDTELLAAADRSVGKAVRRCEREGVSIRSCNDAQSFEGRFLRAFSESRPDFDPDRGRRAFAADGGSHYRYWVAVGSNGEVLATLGTYRFGGVATEIMSVRTRAGRESGSPAQDLLHWHAMREHRAMGDSWFDLAGYAPTPAMRAEAGIKRFKQKWGGREIATPTFAKSLEGRARRRARRLFAGLR
jgi:hypothetical protein